MPRDLSAALSDRSKMDDLVCPDCNIAWSQHGTCSGCGHPDCDCICAFLRDEWPTHPANPEAIDA